MDYVKQRLSMRSCNARYSAIPGFCRWACQPGADRGLGRVRVFWRRLGTARSRWRDPAAVADCDALTSRPRPDTAAALTGGCAAPWPALRARSVKGASCNRHGASRHDRTFIPRSALYRHAAEPMVHWAMTRPPTTRGRWITARRPAVLAPGRSHGRSSGRRSELVILCSPGQREEVVLWAVIPRGWRVCGAFGNGGRGRAARRWRRRARRAGCRRAGRRRVVRRSRGPRAR